MHIEIDGKGRVRDNDYFRDAGAFGNVGSGLGHSRGKTKRLIGKRRDDTDKYSCGGNQ